MKTSHLCVEEHSFEDSKCDHCVVYLLLCRYRRKQFEEASRNPLDSFFYLEKIAAVPHQYFKRKRVAREDHFLIIARPKEESLTRSNSFILATYFLLKQSTKFFWIVVDFHFWYSNDATTFHSCSRDRMQKFVAWNGENRILLWGKALIVLCRFLGLLFCLLSSLYLLKAFPWLHKKFIQHETGIFIITELNKKKKSLPRHKKPLKSWS